MKSVRKVVMKWTAPAHHDIQICPGCPNHGRCEFLCSPLQWVNGNAPLKERILDDPIEDTYDIPDYNAVLYELQAEAPADSRIADIAGVRDIQRRAICAMLAVDIPQARIARLLGIDRRRLYRIIRGMVKK